MQTILIVFCLIFSFNLIRAQDSISYKSNVIELSKLEGRYLPKNIINYLSLSFEKTLSDNIFSIPDTVKSIILAVSTVIINQHFSEKELTDEIFKIYSRFYTHEDVKALLDFYKSETGEKFLLYNAQILTDHLQFSHFALSSEEIHSTLKDKVLPRLESEGFIDSNGKLKEQN